MTHRTKSTPSRRRAALMTALLTLVTACQPRPETAYDVSQPRTRAVVM